MTDFTEYVGGLETVQLSTEFPVQIDNDFSIYWKTLFADCSVVVKWQLRKKSNPFKCWSGYIELNGEYPFQCGDDMELFLQLESDRPTKAVLLFDRVLLFPPNLLDSGSTWTRFTILTKNPH